MGNFDMRKRTCGAFDTRGAESEHHRSDAVAVKEEDNGYDAPTPQSVPSEDLRSEFFSIDVYTPCAVERLGEIEKAQNQLIHDYIDLRKTENTRTTIDAKKPSGDNRPIDPIVCIFPIPAS